MTVARWFVYGSLLDRAVLARRSGWPGLGVPRMAVLPAWLAGWRRVGRAQGGYPTLRRDRAGRVPGLVLFPPAAAQARLAAFEGPSYRLRRVIVRTPRGPIAAFAWIAPDAARRPWHFP